MGLDAPTLAAGAKTFGVRCAFCHGAEGRGNGPEGPTNPPPADLTLTRRDDAYLFWRIATGGRSTPFCSAMPSFSAVLSEGQIWELIAFVRSLASPVDGGLDASGD